MHSDFFFKPPILFGREIETRLEKKKVCGEHAGTMLNPDVSPEQACMLGNFPLCALFILNDLTLKIIAKN